MIMPDFRASVIIPTYNRAHLIARAIRSALAVLRPCDEVIVVDDGSTDRTADAVAEFGDRVRYIKASHRGAGAARNLGIRQAANELIAFLDSDDEWLPGQLELQRRLLEARPEIPFAFTNFAGLYETGDRRPRLLECWRNGGPSWETVFGQPVRFSSLAELPAGFTDFNVYTGDLSAWEMTDWYFSSITTVVRRSLAGDALYFAEDLPVYEDWLFCGLVAKTGPAAYLDCETALNYCHTGARLTSADRLTRAIATLEVFERVWGSDPDFLNAHRDLYTRTVAGWRVRKIKGLIAGGRTREGRQELSKPPALHVPLSCLVLLNLPGQMAGFIARLGSQLRAWTSETSPLLPLKSDRSHSL